MVNGDSIPSDRSSTQGTLILPSVSDTNEYYLFYLNRYFSSTTPVGLYYSIINMSLNGGLGEIVSKNNLIRSFSNISEKLSAVRHGNGRDWWILTHEYGNNAFYEYLLTPYGIDSIPAQNIGSLYNNSSGIQGQMVFSKKGNKLCCAGTGQPGLDGILDIFDYDRCTGILSNWINLNDSLMPFYGCSFSSDGNILYASTLSSARKLYQFDLTAANILASKILLFIGHANYWIGGHQIGPDDKIYITSEFHTQPDTIFSIYNRYLTVINDPDIYGVGCNISPYSFSLGGKKTRCSLPNMVNYKLGADEGSPCDTILNVHYPILNTKLIVEVFPNPITCEINVKANISQLFEIFIYDITSRKLLQQKFTNSVTVNTEQLTQGIYLYEVRDKNGVIKKGIVLKK
jgi:hypothetical protein